MSRRELLHDALRVLASPASEQLEYLKRLGIANCIDELALAYADIAAAGEDMRRCSELTDAQYEAVQQLDRHLSSMSGNEHSDLWTSIALLSAEEWKQVRHLAKKTIDLLNI